VNTGIARILEQTNTLVWVTGEISNFTRAASGHCYFVLKDAQSRIPCVMWRSIAARHKDVAVEDGKEVGMIAVIRVYRRGGYYQLDIQRVQTTGQGILYEKFQRLKKKLAAEGLFDPDHKQQLPRKVHRVGVVTSIRGAAVRDIIKNIRVRDPSVDIVVYDVAVQGDKAVGAIVRALEECNVYGQLDCCIVGRGGGSIEDLWAFNEEPVARALYASRIPTVSAVGHESDTTIADLVADVRAETPSAAGALVVTDIRVLRDRFDTTATALLRGCTRAMSRFNRGYDTLVHRLGMRHPVRVLREQRQRVDEDTQRVRRAVRMHLSAASQRIRTAGQRLDALSPLRVLARGYSVVRTPQGQTVRDAARLSKGDVLDIRLHKGRVDAQVREVEARDELKADGDTL
jgi:exodeoxyribonuclease VII large subunit